MDSNMSENFKPLKRGHWSKEEHSKFVEGIQMYGRDWKKIVEHVGTRSSNQIRSHAQKYFLKIEKKNNRTKPQTGNCPQDYLLQLQTLSYNTYFKFFFDMHRALLEKDQKVPEPSHAVEDDETVQEGRTKKQIKVA